MTSAKNTFLFLIVACLSALLVFHLALQLSNPLKPIFVRKNLIPSLSTVIYDSHVNDIKFDSNIPKSSDIDSTRNEFYDNRGLETAQKNTIEQTGTRGISIEDSDDSNSRNQKLNFTPSGGGSDRMETDEKGRRIQEMTEENFDDFEEDEENERLKKSPYILLDGNVDEGDGLKEFSKSNGPVKKLSYYLPWDIALQRRNLEKCNYPCEFVNDMSKADVVLFRAGAIRDHVIQPFKRPPGQRWVLFTADPAIKRYALTRKDVGGKFNWTATYQRRSDIFRPFGRLIKRPLPQKDYDKIFDGKTRNAAWFVSHCETWSQRETFVSNMQKLIDVDIFGACSNLSCGPVHYRRQDKSLCLPMLSSTYKFYLAFENSLCKDYVSEKFFKLFDDVDVVPVVRGGFDYQRFMPSGIFVDASQFQNAEDLSRYLLRLSNDKEAYVKMLKKKNQWILQKEMKPLPCLVCEAIHTSTEVKHYENLQDQFNGNPPDCWEPRDL